MKTRLRKIGNSQGVLIPKAFIAQAGLKGADIELAIEDGTITVRNGPPALRQGWAADCQRLAAMGEDALIWPDLANQHDKDLQW